MIPSKWLGRNSVVPSAEYAFPSTLVRNRSQTMPVFRQQPERILHISATTTSDDQAASQHRRGPAVVYPPPDPYAGLVHWAHGTFQSP